MSLLAFRRARTWALRTLTVLVSATVLVTIALVAPASAHGSVIDPASRNYGCWLRWGSDFQDPIMATEDPMCWQAWQADANAMWNWNGLYREGVAGDHQGAIPDGQLCSAGHTQDGRYNAMDAIGDWKTTSISNNFQIKLWDQAGHGADYIYVYVTKQGFDPLTQPLAWADLELVGQIGKTPSSEWDVEAAGGYSIKVAANAAGRTGRHMVYTIWQASHMDQSYYFCSDVVFPGGSSGGGSTPTPSPSPSVSPTSSSPSPSASASPTAGSSAACTATYRVTSQWTGGFQGEVQVTAGSQAITGWTVSWPLATGTQYSSVWNATLTTSESSVTARNVSYNGGIAAGASTTFGFLGSWSGSGVIPVPTATCTAL